MVEVMTDKATVTITSPKSGTIRETRFAVGAVVPVHSVLVVFDLGGAASAAAPAAAAGAKKNEPAATAVGDIKEDLPGMNLGATPTPAVAPKANGVHAAAPAAPKAAAPARNYFNEKPLATPATRKLARDLGVDLRRVEPSGPAGRVTKSDVTRSHEAPTIAEAPRPAVSPLGHSVPPISEVRPSPERERTPIVVQHLCSAHARSVASARSAS